MAISKILMLLQLERFMESPKEAAVQRCSVKKVFLKIYQNLKKTYVPESLFK